MLVTLYSDFSKRRNSTKQPTEQTPHRDTELVLKEKTSFINPSFFLAFPEQYVYLKAWNYYYFIDSISYDINGASYVTCSIDVLATFKNAILNTSAFVKYSSSNYSTQLIDSRVSQEITSMYSVNYNSSSELFDYHGTYLMTVTNNARGICTYIMSENEMISFMHDIWLASENDLAAIKIRYGDVFDSILGIRWVPFSQDRIPKATTSAEEIWIGTCEFEATANVMVYDADLYARESVTIPWRYDDFRRYNSFTSIFVLIPYIGKVEIDPMDIIGVDELEVDYVVNPVTGTTNVFLRTVESVSDSRIIGTYSTTIGRNVPISATSIDAEGAIAGTVTALTVGTMLGAGIGAGFEIPELLALEGTKAALNGGLKAIMAQSKGSTNIVGTYAGSYYERLINQVFIEVVSRDTRTFPSELTTLYGRPCNKVVQISTLSGYVETSGFSIDISALSEIKDMINSLMDSGVYLE